MQIAWHNVVHVDASWQTRVRSNGEWRFLQAWTLYGQDLPRPVDEWHAARRTPADRTSVHPGMRDWRIDFCWPDVFVGVEIDGGARIVRTNASGQVAVGGRHNTDGDRWKMCAMASLGWSMFRMTEAMISADPAQTIAWIRAACLMRRRQQDPW